MTKKRRTPAQILGLPETRKPKAGRPVEDHRQQLVLAQAEGQRLKNAKLRGELIERATADDHLARVVTDIRAALLAVPSRLGSRLALNPEIIAGLDSEIREILTTLATQGELPADV